MSQSRAAHFRAVLDAGQPVAQVCVVVAKGSTPREAGTSMLVSATEAHGTIGGGRLEWEAIRAARDLLAGSQASASLAIPLGPEIGQCCGGHVMLAIERADADLLRELETREAEERRTQPSVLVFGAGHVGKALVAALGLLPFQLRWIDERADEFSATKPADHVEIVVARECLAEVARTSAGAAFVVLTHSHSLDALIASAVLERGDFAYLGVIGSKTKRRQFERGFRAIGLSRETIARMICPIGGSAVHDKRPEIIAALVAAELIEVFARSAKKAHPATLEEPA